jgi:hypothetical protein
MYCIIIDTNEAPLGGAIPQMCKVFDREPSQWDLSRTIQEFLMDSDEQTIKAKVFPLTDITEESSLVVVTDGIHKNFVGMIVDFCEDQPLVVVGDDSGQSVVAPTDLVKQIA